jgi:hypothetical protein
MSDLSDALMSTPAAVTAGWSKLGQVLGGSGQASANAYQRGVMQGAQVSDVMEQARRRRDANLGFTNITPALVQDANSNSPTSAQSRAELGAAEIHAGGGNAQQLSESTLGNQRFGFNQVLMDRANNGASVASLNPALAVISGKPVDTTKISDNTVYDPTIAPDQQSAEGGNVPTAIGQSDIGLHLAQTSEANAAAGRNSAEAKRALAGIGNDKAANYEITTDANTGQAVRVNKLTGQELPITDTGGNPVTLQGKGASASDAALKPEEIEEALGKPPTGNKANPDYVAFKNFQSLHAQVDPSFNNDRVALAAYLQAKQGPVGNVPLTSTDDDGNTVPANMADSFSKALQTSGSARSAAAVATPGKKSAPNVGDVEQGYRYIGGDPSQPSSWVKQ